MTGVPSTTNAAACGDGQEVTPPAAAQGNGKPMNRMSDEDVQWILSRERWEFAPDTSVFSPDEVEILNRGVEAFKVLRDSFAEFQEEVCAEYEAKGYVELADDFIEHREKERQSMREEFEDLFDGIDLSGVPFSDCYYKYDEEEGVYYFEEEYESESEVEDDGEAEGAEDAEVDDGEEEGEDAVEDDGKEQGAEDAEEADGVEEGAEDDGEEGGVEDAVEEEVSPGPKST